MRHFGPSVKRSSTSQDKSCHCCSEWLKMAEMIPPEREGKPESCRNRAALERQQVPELSAEHSCSHHTDLLPSSGQTANSSRRSKRTWRFMRSSTNGGHNILFCSKKEYSKNATKLSLIICVHLRYVKRLVMEERSESWLIKTRQCISADFIVLLEYFTQFQSKDAGSCFLVRVGSTSPDSQLCAGQSQGLCWASDVTTVSAWKWMNSSWRAWLCLLNKQPHRLLTLQ